MDGETADGARGEHHQGRDVSAGGGPEARADRRRGGGMEGAFPRWCGECAPLAPRDEEALKDEQIKKLKQKVGELVLEKDVLKEAVKPYLPFGTGDVRRVREAMPSLSERGGVPVTSRAALVDASRNRESPRCAGGVDELLAERIRRLIELHPTYGYRLLWAMLRQGWRPGQPQGRLPRARAQALVRPPTADDAAAAQCRDASEPSREEQRTLGNGRDAHSLRQDGWGHLAAVIDCHDRELVGFEFALRGRAKEAERALEEACIARFGTLPSRRRHARRAQRQWAHLPEPPLSCGVSRLPPLAGIHHAVHARAERDD